MYVVRTESSPHTNWAAFDLFLDLKFSTFSEAGSGCIAYELTDLLLLRRGALEHGKYKLISALKTQANKIHAIFNSYTKRENINVLK